MDFSTLLSYQNREYMNHNMKRIIGIICISVFLLSACAERVVREEDSRVVEIFSLRDDQRAKIGMWILIDESTLLTSAHVVRDDRYGYSLGEGKNTHSFRVIERDTLSDSALLSSEESKKKYRIEALYNRTNLYSGSLVHAIVSRSGSLVRLDGKIREINAKTIGYTEQWQIYTLSWIVLTDLWVESWDSGAPIFSESWVLIDLVHVVGE